MKKNILKIGLCFLLFPVVNAYAELQLRNGGTLVYDTDLNITWFADANYFQTIMADADGLMNWGDATALVEALDYAGARDWRLPGALSSISPNDTNCTVGCLDNEMAYLYSIYLGGDPYGAEFDRTGNHGPFTDIRFQYWTNEEYTPDPASWAWNFHFENGIQYWHIKTDLFGAWPVRDGDIALMPKVTGIWPGSANTGETISLFVFGQNFDEMQTQVSINGVQQAVFGVISPDMIIVRMTVSNELFGPVTVTTPHGVATSSTSFGIPVDGLQVTGIWPGVAGIADIVFVFGSGFEVGATQVRVNGVIAPVTHVVADDMLLFVVPSGATTGPVTVTTSVASVDSDSDLVIIP